MSDLEKLSASLGALPIFPLPNVILLPHEMLPLHIFEPRYRTLVEELLEDGRPLAMAQLRAGAATDDPPQVEEVAGAGFIIRHERLPDGRFNILVRGMARVRLVQELPARAPYREMLAELVADEQTAVFDEPASVEGLRRMLFALCAARSGPGVGALAEVAARTDRAGELADVVIAALVNDESRRRRSLVDPDLGRRVDIAQSAIAELLMGGTPMRQARLKN